MSGANLEGWRPPGPSPASDSTPPGPSPSEDWKPPGPSPSAYRLHHPKWHRERMPIFWWLGRASYTRFITRELTSLAVGYAVLLLLAEVYALSCCAAAHARFLAFLAAPPVLVFHLLVCAALLFHTVTWLNLAPKALVLRLGGRRLPDRVVVAAHYLAWIVASGAVVWLLGGGS